MAVLGGASRWIIFLQTPRSFLHQNFRDRTAGKPKFTKHGVQLFEWTEFLNLDASNEYKELLFLFY